MRRLTLTFDNGPTPGITESVLDALDEAGVRATFFLVGTQLEKPGARAIVERARVAGHGFGNHTYSHGTPLGLQSAPGVASREILRMNELMADLIGDVPLFRPNGRGSMGSHLLNDEAVATLQRLKSTVVLWTNVPRDRLAVVNEPDLWVTDAKHAVLSADWTLLALHDRPSGFPNPGPMAFLPAFLAWAKEECEIVTTFPSSCLPLRRGAATPELARYVTTYGG